MARKGKRPKSLVKCLQSNGRGSQALFEVRGTDFLIEKDIETRPNYPFMLIPKSQYNVSGIKNPVFISLNGAVAWALVGGRK